MEKFEVHTGVGVPLRRSNVDTDQICPAIHLKRVTRHGYEDALFSAWREDSDFVLNHPAHSTGSVLVAGPEFGTGSSREHAVWALQDYGFEVVISERFADIFLGNAGKGGLLAAEVDAEVVERLWVLLEQNPGSPITVDLTTRRIVAEGIDEPFVIDDYVRWRLLEGLDDVGITLQRAAAVESFEAQRPSYLPTTA